MNVSPESIRLEPWSAAPKNDVHGRVFATVHHIDRTQEEVSKQHEFNFRLYAGFSALRMAGGRHYRQTMPTPGDRERLTLNIARSCVDTVHAKTIQSKPKPTFLTMGGSSSSQRKAKMIDRLNSGIFYHNDIYSVGSDACRNALALGTGAVKCWEDWDGKPKFEETYIGEIKVDQADGMRRKPKVMFHHRAVDRSLLLDDPRFKKYADKIKDAGTGGDESTLWVRTDQVADQVAVVEAWRLPSNPYTKNGRHVMCIDNCTLVDEPWERDYHPFVFIRWNPRILGFYGQSIPEQTAGTQYEINVLLRKAQEQMKLAGPKIFIERGSSVAKSALATNEIWGIIEYTGMEPKHVVFQTVDPEVFAHVDRLYQRAFDDVGVSQMAAHSEKPAGLNSGRALLTYDDIESARFVNFGQAYERLYLDLSARGLDIARDSHLRPNKDGKGEGFSIAAPVKQRGKRFLEQVQWKDVDLAKDEYVIQVFPTSALPSTPVGKLQAVGDMMDRGMLKGDQAVSLLDFPDLEKVNSLITAPIDDIDLMLEQMLEDGVPLMPEPFSNVALAVERMNSALLRAKIDGYDEKRLELVRRYIAAADAQLHPKDPAAGAAPPGGGPLEAPSMAAPALPNGMQPPPPPVAGAPGMAA